MLWRKTYISTSRCENLSEDLAAILDVSRKRNAETGLTGVMLVSGGSFYQTLEGNRNEVTQTFFRIASDMRHDGIIVLQDAACDYRAFASWSLAYRDLPQDHEIANRIARIAAGDKPAYRTNVMAAEMDILITSFLSV